MYSSGTSTNMQVTSAGITCAWIGDLQAKKSSSDGDLCRTDQSVWGLSYKGGANNVYSGSTLTYWDAAGAFLSKGYINLVNQSGGTNICPSSDRCPSSDIWWSIYDVPNIYVSFSVV
jgi:hypothetical protein